MKNLYLCLLTAFFAMLIISCGNKGTNEENELVDFNDSLIIKSENLMGLHFDTAEHSQMQRSLKRHLASSEQMSGKFPILYL